VHWKLKDEIKVLFVMYRDFRNAYQPFTAEHSPDSKPIWQKGRQGVIFSPVYGFILIFTIPSRLSVQFRPKFITIFFSYQPLQTLLM